MADPSRYPDSSDDTGVGPDRASTTSTPRWVKVSGIIVAVLVLLIATMMLIGGGDHGPGRHAPSSGAAGPAATGGGHG